MLFGRSSLQLLWDNWRSPRGDGGLDVRRPWHYIPATTKKTETLRLGSLSSIISKGLLSSWKPDSYTVIGGYEYPKSVLCAIHWKVRQTSNISSNDPSMPCKSRNMSIFTIKSKPLTAMAITGKRQFSASLGVEISRTTETAGGKDWRQYSEYTAGPRQIYHLWKLRRPETMYREHETHIKTHRVQVSAWITVNRLAMVGAVSPTVFSSSGSECHPRDGFRSLQTKRSPQRLGFANVVTWGTQIILVNKWLRLASKYCNQEIKSEGSEKKTRSAQVLNCHLPYWNQARNT